MTGILGQLNGNPSRKVGKTIYRLELLYKGLEGKNSVPTDDLILLTWSGRNHHSMAFQTLTAGTDIYKSKKDSKDQESIQSRTTPVPGYQIGK